MVTTVKLFLTYPQLFYNQRIILNNIGIILAVLRFHEVKRIFLLLAILLLLLTHVHGQHRVYYKHYSTNDGLSYGSVVNMMKDSNGFMWFSTWDGLDRFDGVNFKTFKTMPGDNINLSSNRIKEMLEDKYHAIWLKSYDSKIFRLDLETERFDDEVSQINDSLTGNIKQLFLSSLSNLWLTTAHNGLYRIVTDSSTRKIKVYHYKTGAKDEYAINDNHIKLIFEDSEHNIWFSTEKGLTELIRSKNFTVEPFSPKLKKVFRNYEFTCELSSGKLILLGTKNGTIISYNPKLQRISNFKISPSPITVIHADNQRIYVGTYNDGLIVINRDTKHIEHRYYSTYLKAVHEIFEDSHGLIWLETNANGAVRVNLKQHSTKLFTQKVDVENVRHINSRCQFTEANGVVWMSLKGGGFGYYDRKHNKLKYFYNKPGSVQNKMSNFVYCFYIDSTNVLWLCTYRKGIEKFTLLNNNFNFKAPVPGSENYLSNEVRALFEDHTGDLWLATKSGDLYLLDKNYKVISHFSKKYHLGSPLVYSIIEDKNDNIWLGTKGNGIYKVSRQKNGRFKIRHFEHDKNNPNSLSNNDIYSMTQDNEGRIWIGTYGGGLNMIEKKNNHYIFKNSSDDFPGYPRNSCQQIRQIKEDSNGNIWVATTEGLLFFNPHKISENSCRFYHFKKKGNDIHSLGNNDVYCIYQDLNDTLWFGTLGGGLQKLLQYPEKGKTALFKSFTKKDGLSSDVIFSIEGDKENNLWMSSGNGIIKYNTKKRVFKNYNEYDGIDVASFSEDASAKRQNGEIVFGTYNGIYYFKPNEIKETKEKTNLYFTGLKVLNKTIFVDPKKGILHKSMVFTHKLVLKHNQNIFELSFAALDYKATANIQYLYKLQGFDEHWRESHIGDAIYTKVPPGKYTFKVKLMNPGIALNKPCTLQIVIKKPYWETNLAYVIYFLISIVILFFVQRIVVTMIRLRNKVVVEKQLSDLRINFFTNISHELRTPLTLIEGPAQEISQHEKLSPKGKEYVELISVNAKRMLRLVNQLLDFRKIQYKKMRLKLTQVRFDIFVEQICNNFNTMALEKEIDFSTDLKTNNLKIWIDEEKMDMVIFNLLSNAFKFTPAGKKIRVTLEQEGNHVKLTVQDQGIGITESKKKLVFQRFANIHDPSELNELSTGLGLSLSKELIELHNGNIFYQSEKGKGTTFFVELKLGNDHFDKNMVSFLGESDLERAVETDNTNKQEVNLSKKPENVKEKRENILIVEDNKDLREFIRDILSNEFKVYEAKNGKEGYEKSLEIKPQMIISDIMMPEVDGIEMLNMLRENFDTSHIPVILLTAKSSVESRIEGLKFGADAYLTKPFNSIHLKTLINNLIEQRKKLINKFSGTIKMVDFTSKDLMVTDKDSIFLQKVFEIIEQNLSDPNFKVDVISRGVGMGRTNFFDKIKGLTNSSPIDLIKQHRLNKALTFLDSGEFNISEVAYKAGFHDQGYFSRCFKDKFGKSPSQYLKDKQTGDIQEQV